MSPRKMGKCWNSWSEKKGGERKIAKKGSATRKLSLTDRQRICSFCERVYLLVSFGLFLPKKCERVHFRRRARVSRGEVVCVAGAGVPADEHRRTHAPSIQLDEINCSRSAFRLAPPFVPGPPRHEMPHCFPPAIGYRVFGAQFPSARLAFHFF